MNKTLDLVFANDIMRKYDVRNMEFLKQRRGIHAANEHTNNQPEKLTSSSPNNRYLAVRDMMGEQGGAGDLKAPDFSSCDETMPDEVRSKKTKGGSKTSKFVEKPSKMDEAVTNGNLAKYAIVLLIAYITIHAYFSKPVQKSTSAPIESPQNSQNQLSTSEIQKLVNAAMESHLKPRLQQFENRQDLYETHTIDEKFNNFYNIKILPQLEANNYRVVLLVSFFRIFLKLCDFFSNHPVQTIEISSR